MLNGLVLYDYSEQIQSLIRTWSEEQNICSVTVQNSNSVDSLF